MHTKWFCVVRENITRKVLQVQTEHAGFVHEDRGLDIFLHNNKTDEYEFYYLTANFTHFVPVMSLSHRESHRAKAVALATKTRSCIALHKATGKPLQMCG